MLRRYSKSRPTLTTILVVLGGLVSGCATSSVRAVMDVVPKGLSYSMETAAIESPGMPDVAVSGEFEQDALGGRIEGTPVVESETENRSPLAIAPMEMGPLSLRATLGSGRTQLDPELGPMDLGYPLLIDLGAGEAPYDDGVRTIHSVEMTRAGFSDALLQASWREAITTSSMLHATVAMTRFQDLGMLEGADEMRFAWFVLGWKISR